MFASTITIPVLGQPHFLEAALVGLVKNSFYKHRIIVLKSNPDAFSDPDHAGQVRDWVIVDGKATLTHESVDAMLAKRSDWLTEHNIRVIDVTTEAVAFQERYCRGEVVAGKTRVEGRTDVAFKNNLGLAATDTEWTIPNWDADFYPGLHWDKPLVDYARASSPHSKPMLVPQHAQPRWFSELPAWGDPWAEARQVAANALTVPTTRKLADGKPWVTELEFFAYCARMRASDRIHRIHERPGARTRLHWVPAMLRTQQVRDVGGYELTGSGHDLLFDNKLGDQGFQKTGFLDAFILHKGYPPIEP